MTGRPRKLPAPCSEPGCTVITRWPRCAVHAVPDRRRSRRWRAVRAAVLAASPDCAVCAAPAGEVDHVTPLHLGGADLDPANLRAVCRACHAAETSAPR